MAEAGVARPRRNGVNYSGSPPDHLRKIILTPKRKELIVEFRSKDKKNIGSVAWVKRLKKSMNVSDELVQIGDIERWIKTHPWIVSEDDTLVPAVKPRKIVEAPSTSTGKTKAAAAATKVTKETAVPKTKAAAAATKATKETLVPKNKAPAAATKATKVTLVPKTKAPAAASKTAKEAQPPKSTGDEDRKEEDSEDETGDEDEACDEEEEPEDDALVPAVKPSKLVEAPSTLASKTKAAAAATRTTKEIPVPKTKAPAATTKTAKEAQPLKSTGDEDSEEEDSEDETGGEDKASEEEEDSEDDALVPAVKPTKLVEAPSTSADKTKAAAAATKTTKETQPPKTKAAATKVTKETQPPEAEAPAVASKTETVKPKMEVAGKSKMEVAELEEDSGDEEQEYETGDEEDMEKSDDEEEKETTYDEEDVEMTDDEDDEEEDNTKEAVNKKPIENPKGKAIVEDDVETGDEDSEEENSEEENSEDESGDEACEEEEESEDDVEATVRPNVQGEIVMEDDEDLEGSSGDEENITAQMSLLDVTQ